MRLLALAAAATLTAATPAPVPPALAEQDVKFASLVPSGSVWDKTFRRMGSEWKRDTGGRVTLRMYAGGAAGDEPDVIRKMRIGQLHAAALTITGLANIDDAFRVFEIPLFFRSHEEAMHVLDGLTPLIEERLEERGYVLLHWGHVGWIHLFSTEPVRTPDDLRGLKQFVWGDRSHSDGMWSSNGFKTVPLTVTDIPMGLETGLIEAFPAPPLSALAFQWFRSAPYMTSMGASPMIGATVMTTRSWKKLSEEDRAAVLAAAKRAEASLAEDVPRQEQEAIAEMQKRGVTVVDTGDALAEWRALAPEFAKAMSSAVPAEFLREVQRLRDEFRRREGAGGVSD